MATPRPQPRPPSRFTPSPGPRISDPRFSGASHNIMFEEGSSHLVLRSGRVVAVARDVTMPAHPKYSAVRISCSPSGSMPT